MKNCQIGPERYAKVVGKEECFFTILDAWTSKLGAKIAQCTHGVVIPSPVKALLKPFLDSAKRAEDDLTRVLSLLRRTGMFGLVSTLQPVNIHGGALLDAQEHG